MAPKLIELVIENKTLDVIEIFRGYTKFKADLVRGNIWFFKDQLKDEDAIKIDEEMIYDLSEIVQIQNKGLGKSIPTLQGELF